MHYRDARGPDGMHLAVVGDVHGERALMEELVELIAADRRQSGTEDFRLIHLGDYVDRGPDSRGVIDLLIELGQDPRFLAIAGNHDIGFLEFLARPSRMGLFANNGGRETALSYGVEIDFLSEESLRRGHAALVEAVPPEHVSFLAALPRHLTFGDFFLCHAGIRPGVPLEEQDPDDLIWIREKFLYDPRPHPKVVVHGHTPREEPEIMSNRVNVDTGAWRWGRLTALVVVEGDKRILSVAR